MLSIILNNPFKDLVLLYASLLMSAALYPSTPFSAIIWWELFIALATSWSIRYFPYEYPPRSLFVPDLVIKTACYEWIYYKVEWARNITKEFEKVTN